MYTLLFFFAIFCALAYAFYSTFIKSHRNYEQQKTEEQPTHFDLLDDNGDPLPSSSVNSRPSESVSPSVRMVVDYDDDKEPKVRRLRYFCIKYKVYHVSVWPKDQGFQGLDYIEFNIAVITHGEHISLGYVPKDMTREVRNFTSLPCKCYCYIGENNGIYYSCCYVTKN